MNITATTSLCCHCFTVYYYVLLSLRLLIIIMQYLLNEDFMGPLALKGRKNKAGHSRLYAWEGLERVKAEHTVMISMMGCSRANLGGPQVAQCFSVSPVILWLSFEGFGYAVHDEF